MSELFADRFDMHINISGKLKNSFEPLLTESVITIPSRRVNHFVAELKGQLQIRILLY